MYYIKDENGKVFGRYYSQSNALNALQFLEGTGAILFDSDDNIIARAKEKQLEEHYDKKYKSFKLLWKTNPIFRFLISSLIIFIIVEILFFNFIEI